MSAVRELGASDVRGVASMLGRAFEDDPLANHIFPTPRGRRRGLPQFFRVQLQELFLAGGCSYMTEDGAAAALWVPPGRTSAGLMSLVRLIPVGVHVGRRVPDTLRLLMAIDAKHPRQPHYYLGVIGTEPSLQGTGRGSAVLAPGLARCDRDGLPAYVESSKARNLSFYHRHGFELTEQLQLPGAPPLWLMWREPRPPAPEGET